MRLTDEGYMELALAEAEMAGQADEVPIGAVLAHSDGSILARARNRTISKADPTGHAEMLAIRAAASVVGNYRLPGTTLYVTIEPCVMCMGAVLHARLARVVFGAPDPKWGAAGSLFSFHEDTRFNHRTEVTGGVLEDRCRRLMQAFFLERRKNASPKANDASHRITGNSNKRSV